MPSKKLNAAVQTCQDTAGTEISSRELGFPHARTRAESEGRSTADALLSAGTNSWAQDIVGT
eukprot:scaffold50442_cov52-Phaeocystis_antarctica.AAC.1